MAKTQKKEQGKKSRKKKEDKNIVASLGNELRYGRSVSIDFFKKNAWLFIALIAVVISLMGLRYKSKTQMMEIARLEKQLKLEESYKLQAKAKYMSLIRETEMQRLIQENHIDLEFQDEPPYEITLGK